MKIKPLAGLKALPADLKLVQDVSTQRLKFGVNRNYVSIFEPRMSVCGRFEASPQTYGLSDQEADAIIELNNRVDELVDAGLNKTVRSLQDLLGVKTGDVAGQYFSGSTDAENATLMARYVMLEIRWQREDMKGAME